MPEAIAEQICMGDYRLLTHADIDDRCWLSQALADLNALTFGRYRGVVVPSVSFMAWYTRRPGMEPRLCQAALDGDELVSSLFVTVAPMKLNGEVLVCGIIDTVMTHPGHRRRGLARELMGRAIAGMRKAGAEVSLLYTAVTEPPAVPQRLYEGLGYSTYELVDRFVKPPPHSGAEGGGARLSTSTEVRRQFEAALGSRSGWLLLDDHLWRWRRIDRASDYPVELYCARDNTLAALCTGPLLLGGRPRSFAVMSDVASQGGRIAADALRSLLSAVPRDAMATVLCPRSDTPLAHVLEAVGFRAVGTEAAMLLPLSAAAEKLAKRRSFPWYVAAESVIGV